MMVASTADMQMPAAPSYCLGFCFNVGRYIEKAKTLPNTIRQNIALQTPMASDCTFITTSIIENVMTPAIASNAGK